MYGLLNRELNLTCRVNFTSIIGHLNLKLTSILSERVREGEGEGGRGKGREGGREVEMEKKRMEGEEERKRERRRCSKIEANLK